MASRREEGLEQVPPVRTTEDILDTDDIIEITDAVEGVGRADDVERGTPEAGAPPLGAGLPPEDEEVNPVGSYETWDQSGQGLDAVGSGMTGDAGTVGLTGTGFEDDPEL